MAKGDKYAWEESTCPANFIPLAFPSISARDFVACFERKEFGANDPNVIFGSTRLNQLSKEDRLDEYGARLNLLSCLNVTIATEALALQQGSGASKNIEKILIYRKNG